MFKESQSVSQQKSKVTLLWDFGTQVAPPPVSCRGPPLPNTCICKPMDATDPAVKVYPDRTAANGNFQRFRFCHDQRRAGSTTSKKKRYAECQHRGAAGDCSTLRSQLFCCNSSGLTNVGFKSAQRNGFCLGPGVCPTLVTLTKISSYAR